MRNLTPQKSPAGAMDAPAELWKENSYYCFTGAGTALAAGVFTVFLAAFL
jgi:hypothetical protein